MIAHAQSAAPDLQQTEPGVSDGQHEPQIILNPKILAAKVEEWRSKGAHVLSPAIEVLAFAPNHGVNVSKLYMDPDPNRGDVYYDEHMMEETERAIAKIGLMRIAQCAGLSWVPDLTRRVDDRRVQRLWEFQAVSVALTYDGTRQVLQGTAEVDLRDGSDQIGGWTPEAWGKLLAENDAKKERNRGKKKEEQERLAWSINGWSDRRVMQARRFGLRRAETMAMEACIRCLGLKHQYTIDELAKPFIVLRVSYLPDMRDPATRDYVMRQALAGAATLYPARALEGVPARRALPESTGVEVIDIRPLREPELVPAAPAARMAPQTAAEPPAASQSAPAPAPSPARVLQPQQASSTPAPAASSHSPAPSAPGARPVGHVRITEVKPTQSGTRTDGSPWQLYEITVDTGTVYHTFNENLANAARAHQERGTWIEVIAEDKTVGKSKIAVKDIIEIRVYNGRGLFDNDIEL